MVAQVPEGGLTSVEQSLVEHVCCGELFDLPAEDEAVDETAMRSWGEERTCRASVIRDILRGRLVSNPDRRGLRLRGARIAGRLDLEKLTTDINLELVDCFLEQGVLAQDAQLASVALAGCLIEHPAESALDAARISCSALDLRRTKIIGHADFAAVNLSGAHIGGHLDWAGGQLSNDAGTALVADRLQVDGNMSLSYGFGATSSSDLGTVRMIDGHIGGDLTCTESDFFNDSGPALAADGLHVDQSLVLGGKFTATGSGEFGAVRLAGAHIGRSFRCTGERLCNDAGPALVAYNLQVDQVMSLRGNYFHGNKGLAFIGGGEDVVIDLTGARVGGAFEFFPPRLQHKTDSHRLLAVDGLTYAGVPQPDLGSMWLRDLRDSTPRYAAQPYQQLAAGYRALGHDRQARETLIAQRDDQLTRGLVGWPEWWWGRITKVTLGYGYQPWRALWFLAAVLVLSCVLAVVLGAHGALAQTSKTTTPGRSCTVVQQVSVGLDLNLPIGTSLARAACDLTTHSASATGASLTAVGWVLRLLAWVFAALFIAGFTSAVRKT